MHLHLPISLPPGFSVGACGPCIPIAPDTGFSAIELRLLSYDARPGSIGVNPLVMHIGDAPPDEDEHY
jgi:hypothetical protein